MTQATQPYRGFSPTSTAAIEAARLAPLLKSAEMNPALMAMAPFAGLVGGSVLGGLLNEHYNANLTSALDHTPKAKKQQLKKILQHANLNKMPAIPWPRFGNAFYADPDYWGDPYYAERDMPPIDAYFRKHRGALEQARKYGLIAYDPKFGTQGILAHEAGHATLRNQPASSWSRFNQSVLRPLGGAFNSVALPAALTAGVLSGNPLIGAGVGGLLGGVTGGPTLVNEAQATRHAYRYADENIREDEEKKLTHKALNNAWKTYASALLAPAIIGGGVAGAVANPESLGRFGSSAIDFGKGLANRLQSAVGKY